MAFFPAAVATTANLYTAVNSLQTTLSTALGTGDVSVVLASATGFPTAGAVVIGNEVIFYTGVSGATLTGCTRGADGTTAATHSVGVPVGAAIIAFHHNGLMAEVIAVETYLNTKFGTSGSAYTTSRALQTNSSSGIPEVSSVTNTELGYLSGVTSAIQTQMDLKAPKASPTFTGTVVVPTPFTVGAVSVTATGTEMNYLVGVTSAIQTQLGLKAPLASPTFSGTVTSGGPILSTDATVNSITAQASVNGTNPRIRAINTNGTSGQSRIGLIGASGDNGNVEVSITAGKDSSNNSVEMLSGTTKLSLGFGGVEKVLVDTSGNFIPTADNSVTCGKSGTRWSAVWAANGTIQTSMAETKTNLQTIDEDSEFICKVPKPALFTRPGEDIAAIRLGWLADSLPDEAHPLTKDGSRSTEDVYTDSILAMHSLALRRDYKRFADQEAKIALLEARLATLEAK